MILVTGSTGRLGRLVIDSLLARVPAAQIVAGARDVTRAGDLAARGVQVRALDYNRPDTVRDAMRGVEKVLLISGSEAVGARAPQHQQVIDAAQAAGVSLLVYTSVLHADRTTMKLASDHQATEASLRASRVPFALLRNGWYIEDYTENLGPALAHGVMLGSAGQGALNPASRADLAEAAAVVLTSPAQAGRVYELAGDHAYTMADLAAVVARVSGKPVRYQDLPAGDYAATLASFGVPEGFAGILADSDLAIGRGELGDAGGDLRRLLGRPTQTFDQVVAATLTA